MTTALITGIRGFTGQYLAKELTAHGYEVFGTINQGVAQANECIADINKIEVLKTVVAEIKPDFIAHLAAISFVPFSDEHKIYDVNLFGTLNLLDAILAIPGYQPKKILIPSSANVYGNPEIDMIDEAVCPRPINHYGNSKLAMENMVRNYFSDLPIIITRPFNYTGLGQEANFLIPKIVKHYTEHAASIKLGNLDVIRDFSDVRFVVSCYRQLFESPYKSEIVNICSGTGVTIQQILFILNELAGYEIKVEVAEELIRHDEIKKLVGSNTKLLNLIGPQKIYSLNEILTAMYSEKK